MLYLYDRAICKDLQSSFTNSMGTTCVRVVDPDTAVDVVSQIQNDEFQFPAVVVTRSNDYQIDTSRLNFTRANKGVSAVIDNETNMIYDEKLLPVILNYNITVLTSNSIDADELTRELLFKYYSMYFLTIELPYEYDRKVRFGISIDTNQSIEQSSRSLEYLQAGKAYQNIIHLNTQGAFLVTYTPRRLNRVVEHDVDIIKSTVKPSSLDRGC